MTNNFIIDVATRRARRTPSSEYQSSLQMSMCWITIDHINISNDSIQKKHTHIQRQQHKIYHASGPTIDTGAHSRNAPSAAAQEAQAAAKSTVLFIYLFASIVDSGVIWSSTAVAEGRGYLPLRCGLTRLEYRSPFYLCANKTRIKSASTFGGCYLCRFCVVVGCVRRWL